MDEPIDSDNVKSFILKLHSYESEEIKVSRLFWGLIFQQYCVKMLFILRKITFKASLKKLKDEEIGHIVGDKFISVLEQNLDLSLNQHVYNKPVQKCIRIFQFAILQVYKNIHHFKDIFVANMCKFCTFVPTCI